MAVFRFTLGIPGFDDAQIPRVVGAAGAALLAANHFLGAGTPSPAQARPHMRSDLLADTASGQKYACDAKQSCVEALGAH